MAVDLAGDVAVTMFARRGVGRIWQEIHVLALRDGEWTWLGGGGSAGDQDLLADRPTVLPAFLGHGRESMQGADRRVMGVSGGGGVMTAMGPAGRPRVDGGSATRRCESARR